MPMGQPVVKLSNLQSIWQKIHHFHIIEQKQHKVISTHTNDWFPTISFGTFGLYFSVHGKEDWIIFFFPFAGEDGGGALFGELFAKGLPRNDCDHY